MRAQLCDGMKREPYRRLLLQLKGLLEGFPADLGPSLPPFYEAHEGILAFEGLLVRLDTSCLLLRCFGLDALAFPEVSFVDGHRQVGPEALG